MRAMRSAIGAAVLAVAAGCGSPADTGPGGKNALSGTVTRNGTPVADVPLTVTGPAGQVAGGMTNAAGAYLIPDPPVGGLEFQFVAPPNGKAAIPEKYTKPGSGLTFEYKGGKQTFDVDLK